MEDDATIQHERAVNLISTQATSARTCTTASASATCTMRTACPRSSPSPSTTAGPCRATLEVATAGRRRRGAAGLDLDRRRGADLGRLITGGGIGRGRRTTVSARRRGRTAGASETDTAEAPLKSFILTRAGGAVALLVYRGSGECSRAKRRKVVAQFK